MNKDVRDCSEFSGTECEISILFFSPQEEFIILFFYSSSFRFNARTRFLLKSVVSLGEKEGRKKDETIEFSSRSRRKEEGSSMDRGN